MMKEFISNSLHQLNILPLTNQIWTKFKICLFTKDKSTDQQYMYAKQRIREFIPKGTNGIYIIAKDKKVLYIGESEKNIHTRLGRHIDKIYWRTDSRADFFKLEGHQGELTIYYWSLPTELINKRKVIEELLTNALEPEYNKCLLQNKLFDLAKSLEEENQIKIEKESNNDLVELEEGDYYDEFDKDDMLDRIGERSPSGRKGWEKFFELRIKYCSDGTLIVEVGADDPNDLESIEAIKFATNIANKKSFYTFIKVEDDIRLYGQNNLTERMFFFK